MLGSIHWKHSKSTKVRSDDNSEMDSNEGSGKISKNSLAKFLLEDSTEIVRNPSCLICGPTLAFPSTSCNQSAEGCCSVDGGSENSMAIVPVKTTDTGQSELQPGWPLLRWRVLSDRQTAYRSLMCHQISVVQWAMKLPCRNLLYAADHDKKAEICAQHQDQPVALDSQTGALVPVDAELGTPFSPDCNSRKIPKDFEGLHEKFSSSCRLFEYQELVSATSNFLLGMFPITS